jgi:integrase
VRWRVESDAAPASTGVATHLVDQVKLLKAQAWLGHSDPSTTLRHYSHATELDDEDIADELDAVLTGG